MKKRIMVLMLALTAALLFSACEDIKDTYEKGLKAYQEQKYEDALTYFRRAVSQGQKGAVVKADLALTYSKLSRVDEALASLNEAYSASPEDPEVLKRIGMFYELDNDPQTAASYYEQALEKAAGKWTEDSLETQGLLAALYQKNGLYARAISGYNNLITHGYHVPEHLLLAGECYLSEQQIYASTQYFDLLDQCSDAGSDHYLKAYQLLMQKKAEKEALTYLNRGIALIESGKGNCSVGEFYCMAGLYEEATPYAEGTGRDACMTRAMIAFNENDLDACEKAVSEALSDDPDDIDAYAFYLLVKTKKQDELTVKQLITKINAGGTDEQKADALWNQAVMYENAGKYTEALNLLKDYRKNFTLTEEVRNELRFLSRLED